MSAIFCHFRKYSCFITILSCCRRLALSFLFLNILHILTEKLSSFGNRLDSSLEDFRYRTYFPAEARFSSPESCFRAWPACAHSLLASTPSQLACGPSAQLHQQLHLCRGGSWATSHLGRETFYLYQQTCSISLFNLFLKQLPKCVSREIGVALWLT